MLKTIMLGAMLLGAAAATPASAAMHAHGGGHGFHAGHGGFHGGLARGGNFHGGRGFGGAYGYSYGGYGYGGCPWPLLATGVCPCGYGYY